MSGAREGLEPSKRLEVMGFDCVLSTHYSLPSAYTGVCRAWRCGERHETVWIRDAEGHEVEIDRDLQRAVEADPADAFPLEIRDGDLTLRLAPDGMIDVRGVHTDETARAALARHPEFLGAAVVGSGRAAVVHVSARDLETFFAELSCIRGRAAMCAGLSRPQADLLAAVEAAGARGATVVARAEEAAVVASQAVRDLEHALEADHGNAVVAERLAIEHARRGGARIVARTATLAVLARTGLVTVDGRVVTLSPLFRALTTVTAQAGLVRYTARWVQAVSTGGL